MRERPLTRRQRELLEALERLARQGKHWVRAQELGGRRHSWHSAVLFQLARRGLAEHSAIFLGRGYAWHLRQRVMLEEAPA